MAGWPLGKLVGTGITMRLETILSQVASSLGEVEGAETKWLWGEPSDGRRILRYSPVPPERVCVGSATHSDDTGSKCPVERGGNGNGARLRRRTRNGRIHEGAFDGMLGSVLLLFM